MNLLFRSGWLNWAEYAEGRFRVVVLSSMWLQLQQERQCTKPCWGKTCDKWRSTMWSMWNHLSNQESHVHACLQKSQSCLNKKWLNALFTLMNAGLDELIEHCLGRNPDGLWQCLYCQFSSLHKHHVKNHCEAKHISSGGVVCLNCGVTCPTRKALAMHMSRKHKQLN